MATANNGVQRLSSGVAGLDQILNGGFPAGRIYLVHGDAGTGKTTTGLHFLMAGAAAGKRCLGLTLLQTLSELREIITSHGWDTDGIILSELPREIRDAATMEQTVFNTADLELSEVTDAIESAITEYQPECLFLDSLSELGVLVDTRYQLRRQLLRLKHLLDSIECTTILSAGAAGDLDNATLETLVHGVIGLEMKAPEFGRPRRRVLVSKMRGMDFQAGYHDADIVTGGLEVYPRILAGNRRTEERLAIPSGNEGLDSLLGGGIEEGTTCVISGTSGAGKSTLSCLYAYAAALRGVRTSMFCFDERIETLLRRSSLLGMPLEEHIDAGLIKVHQINVGDLSPGQLSHMIRHAVEQEAVRIVILDSLSGYLQSMPGERELITQLHELLGYLSGAGVLSLMVVATHGLFGDAESPIDVSYIADTVILLRHFEARGEVRRCLAVLKKRFGDHEHTIRELKLSSDGIMVGEPLSSFSGLLTGRPRYEGEPTHLLGPEDQQKD
ncbi:MAG: ATPase domain-containing protein [Spirochaetia bacterium]